MYLLVLQITSLILIAVGLTAWRVGVRKRNQRNWDEILGRLRMDWSAQSLSEGFPWRPEMRLGPDEAWLRMQGVRGLCVMYTNAGVMLEIADYATRNSHAGQAADPLAIAALRSDAMQIRIFAIVALMQYGLLRATAGVRTNAQRTAIQYTAMVARLIALLQNHAAIILPRFIECV